MTRKEVYDINKERLNGWLHRLTNQHSTAQILVGVGHDQVSGQITVIVPEGGPTDEQILLFLKETVRQFEQHIKT